MLALLLIALLSQGRSALSVTLRHVLALVPGLYLGAVPGGNATQGDGRSLRRRWTAALSLALCSRWWRTPLHALGGDP